MSILLTLRSFLVFFLMGIFFLHQLDLIMSFCTTSISSSSLILWIVLRWFIMSHILTQLCDSWTYLDGTMHKLLIVEVGIDWIKASCSLGLTLIYLFIQEFWTSWCLFVFDIFLYFISSNNISVASGMTSTLGLGFGVALTLRITFVRTVWPR